MKSLTILMTVAVLAGVPVAINADCSCRNGECKIRYPQYEKFDNLLSCVVNEPSTCTDLMDSLDDDLFTNPGEKLSAEACFDPPTQDYRCSAQGHYCNSYKKQVKGSIEEVAQQCKNDVNCKVFNYHSNGINGELCSEISPKSAGGRNWKLCLLGNFEGCKDYLPPGSGHNQIYDDMEKYYGKGTMEKYCEVWKNASFCDKPISILGGGVYGNGPLKFKDYCKKTCNNCG